MAIKTLEAYSLKCDKCEHQFEDEDFTIFSDKDQMIDSAYDSDWREYDGKYYCSSCSDEHNLEENNDN
ncbi:MAG: hypothetical protein LBE34_12780 [Flavobacteriaceae bacterium]|jgi:DNA-directed RNA polymerase subunit RPC12/RpoP|nr:hypothetical protein [Flavobacteriaceae bacterium]